EVGALHVGDELVSRGGAGEVPRLLDDPDPPLGVLVVGLAVAFQLPHEVPGVRGPAGKDGNDEADLVHGLLPSPPVRHVLVMATVGPLWCGGIRGFHVKAGAPPQGWAPGCHPAAQAGAAGTAVRTRGGAAPRGPWPRRVRPVRLSPACGRRGRGCPRPSAG